MNGKGGLSITPQEVSAAILAVGAIISIIGALIVFRKWTGGEHYVEKYVMAWAGGILLLLLIQVVILSMFN